MPPPRAGRGAIIQFLARQLGNLPSSHTRRGKLNHRHACPQQHKHSICDLHSPFFALDCRVLVLSTEDQHVLNHLPRLSVPFMILGSKTESVVLSALVIALQCSLLLFNTVECEKCTYMISMYPRHSEYRAIAVLIRETTRKETTIAANVCA